MLKAQRVIILIVKFPHPSSVIISQVLTSNQLQILLSTCFQVMTVNGKCM